MPRPTAPILGFVGVLHFSARLDDERDEGFPYGYAVERRRISNKVFGELSRKLSAVIMNFWKFAKPDDPHRFFTSRRIVSVSVFYFANSWMSYTHKFSLKRKASLKDKPSWHRSFLLRESLRLLVVME
jgi:hypothetical protein